MTGESPVQTNRLRAHRKRMVLGLRPLSLDSVAAILNVSPQTVSHWELGHFLPSLEHAVALCLIYRARVEDLFPTLAGDATARLKRLGVFSKLRRISPRAELSGDPPAIPDTRVPPHPMTAVDVDRPGWWRQDDGGGDG